MLMQDKETGRHRGFGFVTFHEGAIADLVVAVKFHTLFERVMEVCLTVVRLIQNLL